MGIRVPMRFVDKGASLCLSVLLGFATMVGCGGGSSGTKLSPGTNNSMLSGQYAFSFAGQNASGAFEVAAGSFTADGNGNITSGLEDVTIALTGTQSLVFTGRYSIGSDNRGTAVINFAGGGSNTWQFTSINTSHALLIRFDAGVVTASGGIDKQDPTAFNTASLNGNYVFGFSGLGVNFIGNTNASLVTEAGNLNLNGQGTIVAGGDMDVNDGFQVFPDIPIDSGSTYAVNTNGRGTATLNSAYGPQNFVFYVVNADDLKFMETDFVPVVSGEVLRQASGPFDATTLNGGYAFTLGGADAGGFPLADGGIATADAAGNLTSVVYDENDGGFPSFGNSPSGTYSVSTGGRGEAIFGLFDLAFYPAANGTMELVDISGNSVTLGMAKKQSGTFGTSSVNGTYAINFTGTNLVNALEEDITGVLSANGGGSLSGTLDINTLASTVQGLSLNSSSYTMNATGQGTATINGTVNGSPVVFNMNIYQVDANTVLFLDTGKNRVMVGIMQK